jgi:ubiquinone/menaquinone biosynthesis C-methylase UbiE
VARFLVRAGFKVAGVDVSSSMLELARVHVPEANFVKMDMRQLEFDADCFDGICAFHSLFHVPREEHLQVLIGLNRLLLQDGILPWHGPEKRHRHVPPPGYEPLPVAAAGGGGTAQRYAPARELYRTGLACRKSAAGPTSVGRRWWPRSQSRAVWSSSMRPQAKATCTCIRFSPSHLHRQARRWPSLGEPPPAHSPPGRAPSLLEYVP